MRGRLISAILVAALSALTGCGNKSGGPLNVAIIGTEKDILVSGLRLSEGAQTIRGATGAGLVALDAQGEIEPALADRWIVTDDGKSYIFRLREGSWPDGAEMTGESARAALRQAIRGLQGTSLGLDLAPVQEVRTMAGRVIEIDLAAPMPDFLRLLAQPELALSNRGFPAGPMVLHKVTGQHGSSIELTFRPPEMRGQPVQEGWQKDVRTVGLEPLDARRALAAFDRGDVDVVLGGTIAAWPLAEPGPLSLGNLRLDNAIGLFGLQIMRETGFLAQPQEREALSMAIDRQDLLSRFNIGGWVPSTRLVPAAIAGAKATERWDGVSMGQRKAAAAARVAAWRAGPGHGKAPVVTIALADQPGYAMLYNALAEQLAQVGIALERVAEGKPADLVLVDKVARYAAPRWFLDQFNCALRHGLCNSAADGELRAALSPADPPLSSEHLARAEALLTAAEVYVPIGAPLRWSMVRGNVTGYAANPWAWHPLPDMATIPR